MNDPAGAYGQMDTRSGAQMPAYSEPVLAELVDEVEEPYRRDYETPLLLYLLTCASTFYAHYGPTGDLKASLIYSSAVMFILTAHELGHFFQAMRYRVPGSLPYFIPMPVGPIGTMGAVIGMRGTLGDRKSLFDIGISGPLAGLVPALVCSVVGIYWSHPVPYRGELGDPLLFKLLVNWIFGPLPAGHDIVLHPLAFAGWVGIFITALNLVPIGQLDGGHILYALLRKKAHIVATWLLMAAVVAVVLTHNWGWSLMLLLLVLVGPRHPPTANDDVELGTGRKVLGWLTLMFVFLGFVPEPLQQPPPPKIRMRQAEPRWLVEAEPRGLIASPLEKRAAPQLQFVSSPLPSAEI